MDTNVYTYMQKRSAFGKQTHFIDSKRVYELLTWPVDAWDEQNKFLKENPHEKRNPNFMTLSNIPEMSENIVASSDAGEHRAGQHGLEEDVPLRGRVAVGGGHHGRQVETGVHQEATGENDRRAGHLHRAVPPHVQERQRHHQDEQPDRHVRRVLRGRSAEPQHRKTLRQDLHALQRPRKGKQAADQQDLLAPGRPAQAGRCLLHHAVPKAASRHELQGSPGLTSLTSGTSRAPTAPATPSTRPRPSSRWPTTTSRPTRSPSAATTAGSAIWTCAPSTKSTCPTWSSRTTSQWSTSSGSPAS